jgi:hypothetical protein
MISDFFLSLSLDLTLDSLRTFVPFASCIIISHVMSVAILNLES